VLIVVLKLHCEPAAATVGTQLPFSGPDPSGSATVGTEKLVWNVVPTVHPAPLRAVHVDEPLEWSVMRIGDCPINCPV